MRYLLRILTLALISPGLNGQATDDRGNIRSNQLVERIESIEKENRALSIKLRSKDSVDYCLIRHEIYEAFTGVPQLEYDFKSTSEKIAVTGLFTKLMQANNPSSDILGFRFNDIILEACNRHFLDSIAEKEEKRRFGSIIRKIIENPVVTSLANTNPVTSVVTAIISTVAGFTTAELTMEKEGNRIRDIDLKNREPVKEENIQAFREELQVYIDFYDAMINNSNHYLAGLDQLQQKYSSLMHSASNYKQWLISTLDTNGSNLLIQLAAFLPDPAKERIAFDHYLADTRVLTAYSVALKFHLVSESVTEFKKEHHQLLTKFLTDYVSTLKQSKQFPPGKVDPAKVDALVRDIEEFIENEKAEYLIGMKTN